MPWALPVVVEVHATLDRARLQDGARVRGVHGVVNVGSHQTGSAAGITLVTRVVTEPSMSPPSRFMVVFRYRPRRGWMGAL